MSCHRSCRTLSSYCRVGVEWVSNRWRSKVSCRASVELMFNMRSRHVRWGALPCLENTTCCETGLQTWIWTRTGPAATRRNSLCQSRAPLPPDVRVTLCWLSQSNETYAMGRLKLWIWSRFRPRRHGTRRTTLCNSQATSAPTFASVIALVGTTAPEQVQRTTHACLC